MDSKPLPEWNESYREALFETDKDKLPVRIKIARNALIRHLQGIDEKAQRRERDRALQALRMLELLQHVSMDASSDASSGSTTMPRPFDSRIGKR